MSAKSDHKVLVIYTGGTIGMVHQDPENPASHLVPAQDESQLRESVPQLDELEEHVPYKLDPLRDPVSGKQIPAIDSSDINHEHWVAMATQIYKNYDKYDGFVILHGTDTMAYTASALSFMLHNLAKPVVITGSQIPISRYDTDGILNFVHSVQIAGYRHTDLPLVPEVVICFADSVFRGNRVRKMSTSASQGFGSPNYPALGDIGEYIVIHRERLMAPADNAGSPFYVTTDFDTSVLDFALFPSLKPQTLERVLIGDDVHGMVLRTYGAGNAPSSTAADGLVHVLAKAVRDHKKIIVNVTPCPEGQVEAGLYAASSALLENGILTGIDMTPEAALTKLMWLLGAETIGGEVDTEEVSRQMQISARGEQTESLVEARYTWKAGTEPQRGAVTLSARPQGHFVKSQLSRAVVRVSGLRVGDGQDDRRVGVFLNNNKPDGGFAFKPRAGVLSTNSPQCVVTAEVRRVVEDGRAIGITLVADDGSEIQFDSMALALFSRA